MSGVVFFIGFLLSIGFAAAGNMCKINGHKEILRARSNQKKYTRAVWFYVAALVSFVSGLVASFIIFQH